MGGWGIHNCANYGLSGTPQNPHFVECINLKASQLQGNLFFKLLSNTLQTLFSKQDKM